MSAPWPSTGDGGEHSSSSSSHQDEPMMSSPRTPQSSTFDSPLLPQDPRDQSQASRPPTRSFSANNFISSPLNPNAAPHTIRSRPGSRGSTYFNRIASEESQALASQFSTLNSGQRGSMVLYRLAADGPDDPLLPPKMLNQRDSVASSSGDSIFSLSSDSKYPSGVVSGQRGFVPYAYDPDLDMKDEPDDDDFLHRPEYEHKTFFSWRGFLNIGVLVILIAALLTLFICYPVLTFVRNNARNLAIDGNIRINATGQAPVLFQLPQTIDPDTPDSVKTRTGFDNEEYELVFSDEFNVDGRTFYPGDDPFWEAVDLWYGATGDLEWHDPSQVTTKNGALVITMEQVQDVTLNHGLQYKSGMLQSWNKFCFTSGYIEVSMTLPGPNSNTQGYWPGAWTMGNLGRPGYAATTDGTWPYSYNDCDLGTFPNQTTADKLGPAAALHSDASRERYNFELSWLPGQKVSACTCPGEEHPGPSVTKGRGAPEIDVLEAERNKTDGSVGQVVSQSAQFAPFSHDYTYKNDTQDAWWVYDTSLTRANNYKGSAVQQAISALTTLPDNMFQGSGANFTTLGFEYWANPKNPDEGFITWQSNGAATARMGAAAVGADQGDGSAMISKRLIPEEPMAIILDLNISPNWQTIDTTTMEFPAIMQVDYVRVYQRKGQTNIGCDPADYPTADYINNHMEAYSNANLSSWSQPSPVGAGYPWPKNSLYNGGC
ncbi:beta-glucan synthesis-associated [Abortiporus biennis]|nr:beta-glucan synthesis-associated [Abortiporus biennis]